MMTRLRLRGEIYILLAAFLWSTGGSCIKLLDGYSPWTISAGRSLVCALFFLVLARGRLTVPSSVRMWATACAVTYTLTVLSFVTATRWTTAANAIILQYTAPLWIAVLGWVFLKERPSVWEIAALIAGGIGVALCLGEGVSWFASQGVWTQGLWGDVIALCSGLAFAGLTIALRRVSKGSPVPQRGEAPVALVCLMYGNLLAALIGAPALLSQFSMPGIPDRAPVFGWLVLLWLGLGQLGGGYWFFQRGLRTTRALTASLISLIEPVINPVWVALLVGEIPSVSTFFGGVFVLISVVLCLTGSAKRSAQNAHPERPLGPA